MFSLSLEEWTAVELSLRIAVVATLVSLPFGIAVAWLLARKDFWGKALLDGIVHLPLAWNDEHSMTISATRREELCSKRCLITKRLRSG